ncbi:unnamed protein product [Cylindrotheca closterium]|uniref:Uncharacterized protein n=1 Tax=Cylindrotheca closterium TaxID=2856 RepID=A0AAD2JMG4_9STRA|nr:unnamed protein product [Cylindrotheca closterium]
MSLTTRFLYSKQNSINSNTSIPDETTIVDVEASVKSIHEGAFAGLAQLRTIQFPPTALLQTIQARAFLSCQALTKIDFPRYLREIKEYAFLDCRNLETIQFYNDGESSCCLKIIHNNAFGDCNMLGHVEFPPSLTTIGRGAFFNCRVLSFSKLPEGLARISAESFASCNSLQHLMVPPVVTTIGEQAFSYCSELLSIILPFDLKSIGNSAFLRCSSVLFVSIPDTCHKISKSSFYGCDNLVLVDLPQSIDTIEQETFKLCVSLKTIAVPFGVRRIEKLAFAQCESLESVELSEQIKVIGDSAFLGCKLLTNIAIPSTISKIGRNAFSKCDHLLKIFWGDEDVLVAGLLKRFEKNPIGKIVYSFGSMMSHRSLSSILKDLDEAMLSTLKNREDNNHNLQDVLGLTPLHMFALSQHCNLEVCIRLLSFDIHAVTTKDEFHGALPITHACRTNAPTEIVKLLLQAQCAVDLQSSILDTTEALMGVAMHASGPNSCETLQYLTLHKIESRLNELGHEPWQELVRSTARQMMTPDSSVATTLTTAPTTSLERKRQVELVMSTLELYEHKKSLSFLEQALWKSQMDDSFLVDEADRWNCRINCGDEIVISNVLPFLGWQGK